MWKLIMNASQSAWHRGKVDYKLGVAYHIRRQLTCPVGVN